MTKKLNDKIKGISIGLDKSTQLKELNGSTVVDIDLKLKANYLNYWLGLGDVLRSNNKWIQRKF